jgi:hypothetical protein
MKRRSATDARMKASSDDSSTGTSASSPRTDSRTAVASVACCRRLAGRTTTYIV